MPKSLEEIQKGIVKTKKALEATLASNPSSLKDKLAAIHQKKLEDLQVAELMLQSGEISLASSQAILSVEEIIAAKKIAREGGVESSPKKKEEAKDLLYKNLDLCVEFELITPGEARKWKLGSLEFMKKEIASVKGGDRYIKYGLKSSDYPAQRCDYPAILDRDKHHAFLRAILEDDILEKKVQDKLWHYARLYSEEKPDPEIKILFDIAISFSKNQAMIKKYISSSEDSWKTAFMDIILRIFIYMTILHMTMKMNQKTMKMNQN